MLVEHRGDILFCGGLSTDFYAFGFRVLHAAFYARSYHLKLQFGEHSCHLHERFTHGINFAVTAINRNAAHDDQAQMLFADDFDDLTELLCGSGKTADFQRDERVAFLRGGQKYGEVLLQLGISMLIFKKTSSAPAVFSSRI